MSSSFTTDLPSEVGSFSTSSELFLAIQNWAKEQSFAVNKSGFKEQYGHGYVVCSRSGKYQPLPEGSRRRVCTTLKTQFPRIAQRDFKSSHPEISISKRDISNLKNRKKRDLIGDNSPLEYLINNLSDDFVFRNATYSTIRSASPDIEVHQDDQDLVDLENNTSVALFFCHRKSIELTKRYPTVLIMDATYKTNAFKMPLLSIIGITGTNKNFYSAFCFLKRERTDYYFFALSTYIEIFGVSPAAIITDRELALMNSIKMLFPQSLNILCLWHINRNIQVFKSATREDLWDEFWRDWMILVNSTTEQEYECAQEFLEIQYSVQQDQEPTETQQLFDEVVTYIKNWLVYYQHFIKFKIDEVTHLGNYTTSRVEGSHFQLKRDLALRGTNFLIAVTQFKAVLLDQFAEIKKSITTETSAVDCDLVSNPLFIKINTDNTNLHTYNIFVNLWSNNFFTLLISCFHSKSFLTVLPLKLM
ncbi:hypothetical protein P9112_001662 [Eukaryota sp. TZLM1-RC]